MIEDALRECGSKTRAAERLGLTRQSLQADAAAEEHLAASHGELRTALRSITDRPSSTYGRPFSAQGTCEFCPPQDRFITAGHADALVEWVAVSGKSLTTIYATH